MTKQQRLADINTRLLTIGRRYEEIKYQTNMLAEQEWLSLLEETGRLIEEKKKTI